MSTSPLVNKPHLSCRILPELIGVLVVILVTYWSRHGLPLNHDTSWYLISTGWWLDGARIGEDIAELNPPLAYYLTAPAGVFARLLSWDTTEAMVVYVLIIWFVSVVWFSAIGARSHDVAPYRRRALVAAACLAFFVLSLSDFAQRDFLMIVFALPYLALVSFHPYKKDLSTSERVAIGIYATLGLAL
jgi:hypothetical protein